MDPEFTNENEPKTSDSGSSISSDLIRGHINTIILRTLYDGDKYGYEIINEIEEKSKGQYSLKQPTLYSALKRLESQDFVTSYWGGVSNGGRRKYFQITDKGRQVVEQNLAEWEYSRTVIDSLISEKDYDFNNPPPTPNVDFKLLKKSTTRVVIPGGESDDADDFSFESVEDKHSAEDASFDTAAPLQEAPAASTPLPQEQAAEEPAAVDTDRQDSTYAAQSAAAVQNSTLREAAPQPAYPAEEQAEAPANEDASLSEDDRRRIHDNYKVLIGDDTDATSYYYSHVGKREQAEAPAQARQPEPEPLYSEEQAPQYYYEDGPQGYDDARERNREISSELLYSSKSPAERNYKELISKLYDNTSQSEAQGYPPQEYPAQEAPQPEPQTAQPAYTAPQADAEEQQPAPEPQPQVRRAAASNIEFYDIEERAENEGLKVTTANGTRNRGRSASKPLGDEFDKGKVLFTTAVYVFIIALAESILNICLMGVLESGLAYVILPFVFDFIMLGVFLFLYLRGYGKNSRKSQSRSYVSASFILYVNLVLVICLIAFLIISAGYEGVEFRQILLYAIFPCIYVFNIPLFALLYTYNCNKE